MSPIMTFLFYAMQGPEYTRSFVDKNKDGSVVSVLL